MREPPERNSLALVCDCAHVESGLHSNAKDAKKTNARALGILLVPDTEASSIFCQTLRPELPNILYTNVDVNTQRTRSGVARVSHISVGAIGRSFRFISIQE
jgi:hypothetical protein